MKLKNVVIKVEEDLHVELKIKVARKKITLQDYVKELIKADLKKED